MYKLPEKLVKLRKHYRYSQKYVAEYLGIDTLRYMSYENGGAVPVFAEIQKLSVLYRIRSLELFREEEELTFHTVKELPVWLQPQKILEYAKKKWPYLTAAAVLFLLAAFFFMLSRPQVKEYMVPEIRDDETFAASDTSVVLLKNGKLVGSGDGSNGQFNLAETDLIKVTEGATFSVALRKDGTLVSAGLLDKFADELKGYRRIVALEAGNGHILLLDDDGRVSCVGDNTYGQCDFKMTSDVKRIFALPSASILMNQRGEVEVSGNVFGKSRIEKLNGIRDIAVSDNFIIYALENGKVEFETRGKDFRDVHTWSNVVQVVATNDFVAALTEDNTVLIAIDNYMIQDEVHSWKDIRAIAAGRDYLVATNGEKVFGVGKNTYRQFEENSALRNSLPAVRNVQVRIEEDKINISFDPVINASAYLVAIDVGTGFSVRTAEAKISVNTHDFEPGKTYLLHITALGEGGYENSETLSLDFTYRSGQPTPDTTASPGGENVEVPFSLEKLTGKTRINLEAYLSGLGVPSENITAEAGQNMCTGSEEIIETVSGIGDYEMITKSELATRIIRYTYCYLENSGK